MKTRDPRLRICLTSGMRMRIYCGYNWTRGCCNDHVVCLGEDIASRPANVMKKSLPNAANGIDGSTTGHGCWQMQRNAGQ